MNKQINTNYKSASLIFVNNSEYLLCREYRKNKTLEYQPIGGKVEDTDINLLYTSVREFVEETNLENIDDFKEICKDHDLQVNKENMINIIYEIIDKNYKQQSICVNKENIFMHRFFTVNLNNIANIPFINLLLNLPQYFNDVKQENSEVEDIVWLNTNIDTKFKQDEFSFLMRNYCHRNKLYLFDYTHSKNKNKNNNNNNKENKEKENKEKDNKVEKDNKDNIIKLNENSNKKNKKKYYYAKVEKDNKDNQENKDNIIKLNENSNENKNKKSKKKYYYDKVV